MPVRSATCDGKAGKERTAATAPPAAVAETGPAKAEAKKVKSKK